MKELIVLFDVFFRKVIFEDKRIWLLLDYDIVLYKYFNRVSFLFNIILVYFVREWIILYIFSNDYLCNVLNW